LFKIQEKFIVFSALTSCWGRNWVIAVHKLTNSTSSLQYFIIDVCPLLLLMTTISIPSTFLILPIKEMTATTGFRCINKSTTTSTHFIIIFISGIIAFRINCDFIYLAIIYCTKSPPIITAFMPRKNILFICCCIINNIIFDRIFTVTFNERSLIRMIISPLNCEHLLHASISQKIILLMKTWATSCLNNCKRIWIW